MEKCEGLIMSIDELITIVLKRKKHGDVSGESSDMQNDPLAPLKNEPNFTVVQKCGKSYKFCKRVHVYVSDATEEFNDIMRRLESNKNVELQHEWSKVYYDRQSANSVVEIYWRNVK